MRYLILAVILSMLVGCASPPTIPQVKGTSGTATGGDAESSMPNIDFAAAWAQPGATAVSSPVRNEDRVQYDQAGDAPQLVLGGGGKAALAILEAESPMEALIQLQIKAAFADREKAGADLAAIDARLDALRADLTTEYEAKLVRAKEIAGSFKALKQIIFVVTQIKLNGVPQEKLTAEAIKAAAENMKAALQAADNATK